MSGGTPDSTRGHDTQRVRKRNRARLHALDLLGVAQVTASDTRSLMIVND